MGGPYCVIMNLKLAVFWIFVGTAVAQSSGAAPTPAFDLVGNWGSTLELGKFKLRLIVKVTRSPEGKLSGKIDIPDQGARDIPVSAMLCNFPAVRWEFDPFDNTAFSGKVSPDGNEIAGEIEEGPGGRPLAVRFKRLSAATEPERVYTFQTGEARDFRGYWLGMMEADKGVTNRVGLKIGRGADGSYGVLLDMLDRGAKDISASTIAVTNSSLHCEWQLLRVTLNARLDGEGDQLSGSCEVGGKSTPITFARRSKPAGALPDDISFTPDANTPDDIRGEWKGALQIPDNTRLRLVLRIGKTPDGTFGGTLASPDQGGGEIPMTSGGITNGIFRLEWNGIRGVFKGTLTNSHEGAVLDGAWEQMGPGLKLRMERVSAVSANPPTK